jgi:phage terminase large subunit-like protein
LLIDGEVSVARLGALPPCLVCHPDTPRGEPCILAVDLASKADIAALVLLFERDGKLIPFGRFYLPEAAVDEAHKLHYRGWAVQERLVLTPGDVS